jgi:hypothetical protein
MKNKDQILLENLYEMILEENSLYAWMDPSGKVITNKYGEGHFQAAKRILNEKYGVPVNNIMFAGNAYGMLFDKQWLRLTYIGSDLFCHNNKISPNQKQIKELKDLGIENNMNRVLFDNEEDDYRVLWTSRDAF